MKLEPGGYFDHELATYNGRGNPARSVCCVVTATSYASSASMRARSTDAALALLVGGLEAAEKKRKART